MKLPNFTKVTKGDAPDVQDDVWTVVTPLMDQVAELTKALQGRLDLTTNGAHEIRELPFKDDEELRITLQRVKGKPIGVILLWEALYDYTQLKWKPVDESVIKVKITWSTSPSTPITARILILGGA